MHLWVHSRKPYEYTEKPQVCDSFDDKTQTMQFSGICTSAVALSRSGVGNIFYTDLLVVKVSEGPQIGAFITANSKNGGLWWEWIFRSFSEVVHLVLSLYLIVLHSFLFQSACVGKRKPNMLSILCLHELGSWIIKPTLLAKGFQLTSIVVCN